MASFVNDIDMLETYSDPSIEGTNTINTFALANSTGTVYGWYRLTGTFVRKKR